MTPFRKETRIYPNQPVRFYKIVALSFLLITIALLATIVFMSSKRAVITITTKETPVDTSFAVKVAETADAQSVAGKTETVEVTLTKIMSPEGNKEEPGVATGIITIHNDSQTDQPLVATTRFLSFDNVLFRLKERVVAPAGGTIDATVYADQEGAEGNVEPTKFTIPGLNETRQKEVYGSSSSAMTGGVRTIGIFDDDDKAQAEKQMQELVLAEGQNLLASKYPEMKAVYSVLSTEHTYNVEIGEEVSGFEITTKAVVLGVFYQEADVVALADTALTKRVVDDTEIIRAPETVLPTVSLESYQAETGVATLTVFFDGIATLNPDSKQLEKTMFFGKSRDEIRRYVLSLDHVHSVEVKFTPAWIQNAPQVADHINIVVKSVK